jgi:nucleoid-associated protein Lsr2
LAQRTIVELIDDLDGGQAHESVAFSLDGVQFTIDLSKDNADKFRDLLSEYVEKGTRLGGRKQRGTTATLKVNAGGNKEQNQAIREWARSQGKKISDRGRIPADLVTEFQEAHGG